MSEPDELSAPRDPGSYRRGRLTGPTMGLLAGFGVLCLAAGYGLARFGPDFPSGPPPKSQPAPGSFFGLAPDPAPSPPVTAPLPTSAPPASDEVARLAERVSALESRQGRVAEASAAALAAAALMQAAQTSRPFPAELAAAEAVAPPSAELRALKPYAERGVPSRAALTASFPEYAARAAAVSRAPDQDAGLLARIAQALSRVVTLRRVGDVPGQGVDAVIARAERELEDGDLVAALSTLDGLPPAGRSSLAPWRERAELRATVDRRVADIRARALEDLAAVARSGG